MGIIDKIKGKATDVHVAIQDSRADELSQLFNKMFFLPKDIEEETRFVRQVMTRGLESQERRGLHASAMLVSDGEFCLRQQVLSLVYKQSQDQDTPVHLKRIFEQGNAIHEKWQRLFIRAKYGKAEDMDRTRVNEKYMMSFSPDAVVTIPEFYPEPMVVEIKSVNSFSFQKQTKHPSAWKQCQWYMYNLGLKKGIVLSEDKNTQDYRLELYDYDPELVAPFIDRAESIVYYYKLLMEEHKMVAKPKEATSPSCKKCSDCFMKGACWNTGMGRIKL